MEENKWTALAEAMEAKMRHQFEGADYAENIAIRTNCTQRAGIWREAAAMVRKAIAETANTPAPASADLPVAWRTDYRDLGGVYRIFHEREPHPAPLTSLREGHSNKIALYAHPAPAPASADLRGKVASVIADHLSAGERAHGTHYDLADACLSAISLAQSEQLAERDARIAELTEALAPFATEAMHYDKVGDDGMPTPDLDDCPDEFSLDELNNLTIGHLRAARAARQVQP